MNTTYSRLTSTDLISQTSHKHPIPSPSEPRQYRAIGLVRGIYQPVDDLLTRGVLLTEEGTEIDAVLLGRMISLVKKHIDLHQSHLWVVYPRTREKEQTLHVQLSGLWNPQLLHPELLESEEWSQETPSAGVPGIMMQDGYFSVRGEVVFYSHDDEKIIVRIQQIPRKPTEKRKFFKIHLQGLLLAERAVGHFWDLHILRRGNNLLLQEAHDLGFIPKKRIPRGRHSKGQATSRSRFNHLSTKESTAIKPLKKQRKQS
ncbi:hypothetical protein K4A83_00900 [Spirulina subsalsa FACHB-351]|uniref:Uncharacterized protein n=1 Tax=Spirulina subsalsa FACHB-351 TaxID=234711 RepID=A0ABT3L011_9CYAN|nr:hypothetical protein [Spirulina subsalsa]MCW6034836.1 hypothetical protein [Spirulina subsalsa FACHB-351]